MFFGGCDNALSGERREEEAETPHTTPHSCFRNPQTPAHAPTPNPTMALARAGPYGTDPLEMMLSGFMPLMTAGGTSSARMMALDVAEV